MVAWFSKLKSALVLVFLLMAASFPALANDKAPNEKLVAECFDTEEEKAECYPFGFEFSDEDDGRPRPSAYEEAIRAAIYGEDASETELQTSKSIWPISPDALTADKRPFEGHVKRMLFVSLDDVRRGRNITKIDMEVRKLYFSDSGWKGYLNYVGSRKEILKKIIPPYMHPQSAAWFFLGSQEYIEKEGKTYFKAIGNFRFSDFDFYLWGEKFELEVVVVGDLEKPKEMIIEDWQVTIVKKE